MSADTDMVKLKACPFCGGEADVQSESCGWRVVCVERGCYTCGPWPDDCTEAEAIAAWNTRAALDASGIGELKAQNAALCEARDALIAELSRERQVRMELQTRLLDGDRP